MPNTDDAEDTKKILIFVEVVDKPMCRLSQEAEPVS